MKVKESRFQVHDELTAPERSLPILKGALSGGGQLSNLLGVLAGSPATLRAYALARSELRHGTLPLPTQQRIALAAAARGRSDYALAMLQRTARDVGLGVDEIALAKRYDSRDEREAALLRYLRALDDRAEVPPPTSMRRPRRPAGATSSCSRPSPTWPSRGSPRSSPARPTCRTTDRSRRGA